MGNVRGDEPDFKVLFNSAPNLYMVLNPDYEVVAATDMFLKSVGQERADLLGRNVFEAFLPNPDDLETLAFENFRKSLDMVVKTGFSHSMDVEKYAVRKNPRSPLEDRYWSACNSPVFNDNKELIYIIHRTEDVTELVRLQYAKENIDSDIRAKKGLMEAEILGRAQEIQEANMSLKAANDELEMRERELRSLYERLARVDKQKTLFFANISHELRTPLTLILGHVDRLLGDSKNSMMAQGSLMTVKRNAQALLRHVNDLLDVARFDAGELKPRYINMDMSQLFHFLKETFAVLAGERHINFSMEAPLALFAQLDSEMVQRVLMNLLSNAFRFTPDYGVIRGRVEVVRKGSQDFVRLSVSDSGPGIPTHLRHSIFERFFQVQDSTPRTSGGTGLGLAIVKDFTDILGGSVEVQQSPEGGALFVVELPLRAPVGTEVHYQDGNGESLHLFQRDMGEIRLQQSQGESDLEDDQDLQKPLVLVVEDNDELRRFVIDALKAEYRCVTARNGSEGFEKAREYQPDLVLTDLMMPEYDGEYLIEKLRSEGLCKDIPIMILTAKVDEALKIRLLDLGVQEYLFKPFMTEEILVRVRNEVRDYRARRLLQRELEFREDNIEALAREVTFKNQELQRLSRLKDEFLATLSHELRTPVSVIFGYAEILSEESEDKEVMEEAIEAITRNAKIQLRLVSDLLDISKSITGKIVLETAESDIRSILDDVLYTAESAARAKKIQISTVIDEGLMPLWVDAVRMSQIIWYLVSNAIKFTPTEGNIEILASQQDGMVEIAVRDSGKGIDPAFLPYIFDRFRQQDGSVTRKFGGLGLGLAIVKHLVELHGGTVRAESRGIGQGATFVVSIPAYQTMAAEGVKSHRIHGTEILKGRSILVVDDDPDTLQVVTLILRKQGMNVLQASNAQEARNVLRDLIPDALISDIGMPEMNGYEFIRLVRNTDTPTRGVPALALTAFASNEVEAKALEAGFDVYLAKPIESKKLLHALSQLLSSRLQL